MDSEGTRRVEGAVMLGPSALTMDINPPGGRMFWLEDEMLPSGRQGQVKPVFRISEVAKVFFARSADWLRWLGTQHDADGGIFELDGRELTIKRTETGNRTYTLVDVERLAHALLQHGRIDGQQFVACINLIRWMAYSYKILKEEDMAVQTDPVIDGQLTIDGIDEEIAEVNERTPDGKCLPCQRRTHKLCVTALEVEAARKQGQDIVEVEQACSCYLKKPDKH